MTNELTSALPQESESQRIGRFADKCLQANIPNSWLANRIDGGNDFGYDYQIQVVMSGLVKDSFRVQLKGTTDPKLITAETEYSISLELSTVNYYARATEPVLLVLCDLSVDVDHAKNCPLYFQWIQDDLQRIRERGVRDDQDSVTFHIPVANRLDHTTNLSPDIERFRRFSKLGEQLDIVIERDKPSLTAYERADFVSKLAPGLEKRSAALLDSLVEEPTSSWVEAREGTLQWYLKEATSALRSGNAEEAQRVVSIAEGFLSGAKQLEQADYWHVVGRLRTFSLDGSGARDAFDEACRLSDDAPRHLAPLAEAELRLRYKLSGLNDFTDVIARLTASDPSVMGIRARLIAAEGRYDDAIIVVTSISGLEGIVAKAIILTMQALWDETIVVCDAGLAEPVLRDSTKQLFLILRARARFSLAIGAISTDEPETHLPLTGPAGAKPDLLKEAWSDIVASIISLRASRWPGNVEMLSDIWAATATMLGLQRETLPLMAEAGEARPSLPTLQAGIESLAAQIGNFTLALEANARQPDSNLRTLRRISLLHLAGLHKECVDLLVEHENSLPMGHPMLGYAASLAIFSADRIVRPDLSVRWEQKLESQPEHAPQLALLRYFRMLSQKLLSKDIALAELERQYDLLGRPRAIVMQLFHELDAMDARQAERCVELAEELKAAQLLDIESSTHLAQALTTLGRWDDLLKLSNQALLRFEGSDRLSAIGALALDKLGMTGEAHARLQSLIEKSDPDALAINTYISIASRSGFTNEAVSCIERVLANEQDRAKQIECLRHLFSLIHLSEPSNPRLVDIAWAIGQKANPDDEAQEGLFLMAMFSSTLLADMPLDETRKADFQRRLDAFTTKFPNSKIMKRATFPDDASPEDLMRILRDVIGADDKHSQWRAKIQNELRRGISPIPYAWRPRHVLDGIPDLLTLWEVSKRSGWDDHQLHLSMVPTDWQPVSLARMREQVPLLDLISLLVIGDLGLFDALFRVFPKIAIGKATLLELQQLLSPMSGTPFRQKCLDLQNILKERFQLIEQPSIEPPNDSSFRAARWSSEEVAEAAKLSGYMIFSDDMLFRIYADPPAGNPPSICTLDLLLALDEAGILVATEVARHIATLCSWRVGLSIPTRYQIAILPDALGTARSVSEGIDILRADFLCNTLFNGLWDLGKPYSELQGHAGSLLRNLVANPKNSIESVAALAGLWLGKAKLHLKAPTPVTRTISLLIMQAAFDDKPMDQDTSRRLWSVFHALIEQEWGDLMDGDKYRDAIHMAGRVAAEIDQQKSLNGARSMRERLTLGLTNGTSDSDRFANSYTNTLLEIVQSNQSASPNR